MRFRRQLPWRIVAAQMLVVVVGVLTLSVTANLLAMRSVPPDLLPMFRAAVMQALSVAALAATVVGLAASLLIVREILRPLRAIAQSSRRIAAGHYDERVTVPASDELAAMATSFNQMAAALEHVEQQRVALIANVAHELRTPLAGLEGYLEGLEDGVFTTEPETLTMMRHESRRLRRLVDDLQTLSRVEAGQVELYCTSFDLRAVAQRVVAQLRPQAPTGCLVIDDDDFPEPGLVYADADRTAQILLNLIGNALRYTPETGCITVRLTSAQRMAQVIVHDTGIGIPAEALPYLFERFYRVDPSRSRRSGGSGIGLTIARRLAWAMGGDLTAASAGLGHGSTFTLTLPRSTECRVHES
jgi:histidine kinase